MSNVELIILIVLGVWTIISIGLFVWVVINEDITLDREFFKELYPYSLANHQTFGVRDYIAYTLMSFIMGPIFWLLYLGWPIYILCAKGMGDTIARIAIRILK